MEKISKNQSLKKMGIFIHAIDKRREGANELEHRKVSIHISKYL